MIHQVCVALKILRIRPHQSLIVGYPPIRKKYLLEQLLPEQVIRRVAGSAQSGQAAEGDKGTNAGYFLFIGFLRDPHNPSVHQESLALLSDL